MEIWQNPDKPNCAVCSAPDAILVGWMQSGRWTIEDSNDLHRHDREIPLTQCTTCGHVQVGVDYDDDFLSSLYNSDKIIGTDQPIIGGCANILYCEEEVSRSSGLIIDIGCGRGEILRILRDSYDVPKNRLLGIDFQSLLPEGIPFAQADLNAPPLDHERNYDAEIIFCNHVLEHIRHPRTFLHRIRRMLAPSGCVYIEVPNMEHFDAQSSCIYPMVNPQHIHYFTLRSLSFLVSSCGFSIDRMEKNGAVLRILARCGSADNASASSVERSLLVLSNRRRDIAKSIVDEVESHHRIGLWGLGMDFSQMLKLHQPFETIVANGSVTLFDLLHAGRRFNGQPIVEPDQIPAFEGKVWLLPSSYLIADRMLAAARRAGWPDEKVYDPWRGSQAIVIRQE